LVVADCLDFCLIASFQLPGIGAVNRFTGIGYDQLLPIGCRSDPSPSPLLTTSPDHLPVEPHTSSEPTPCDPSRKPFAIAEAARTIVLYYSIRHTSLGGVVDEIFNIFLPASALLDFCLTPLLNSEQASIRGWEEWGPSNTRWIKGLLTDQSYVCYVHGTKFVSWVRVDNEEGEGLHDGGANFELGDEYRIQVLDFNTKWKDLGGDSSTANESNVEVVTEETVFLAEEGFDQNIVSRLPYRSVLSKETFRQFSGLMIDDERVIVIKESDWDGTGNETLQILCV